ncbi:MAG TPA: GGDEF domain-containing protein [Streptosporangiaceae bacterium]|nr:GGDEF domain-containing protein [Streptosporangiaceae bacterium]
MNAATLAWPAVWAALAATAAIRLLRRSRQPEPAARNGYRWLAVAAVCLGAGGVIQHLLGGLAGGAQPLRVADLLSLAALPAFVIGIATLTADSAAGERGGPHRTALTWAATQAAADGSLIAASLFVVGLVTVFLPDYARAGIGVAAFALDLIRPVADLIALGILLPFSFRQLRLTLLPVLALLLAAVGDSLAVGARASGLTAGAGSHLALLGALGLLAVGAPGADQHADRWARLARFAAPVTVAVGALTITGFAIFGQIVVTPVLAVAESLLVLLLAAMLTRFAVAAARAAESAHEAEAMFRALVAKTSDAVLRCDLDGMIGYASQAVSEFGYTPDQLVGKRLAELVHPEDRRAGIRAATIGLLGESGQARFTGRVRGSDGSWRDVEATLSRYHQPGQPQRLLVTCHDVSDLVALRRQLTQLTFHDGRTGLPNRFYLEDRVREFSQQPGSHPGMAAAILVGLDGYSAVNDMVGLAGADLLIAQAGRRLRAAVPPDATVARWGADEFAVLASGLAEDGSVPAVAVLAEVMNLGERLAGEIAADPFSVAGKEISLTASVGVAVSAAGGADQILATAYLAMTRAKEAGGGQVEAIGTQLPAKA